MTWITQVRAASLKTLSLQPVRFGLVGIANTLTGLSIIYGLKWLFGVHDILANFLGYAIGLCVSYVLNARWTFSFRGPFLVALPRFGLVIVAAYLANLATVTASLYWLRLDSYVAQAAGVAPYAIVTYCGSKWFAFDEKPKPGDSRAARISGT
jgi:putative flippase GtrA